MKHTLRFATRHPRYYHTMVVRRLGPGRWEVELFSQHGDDYIRGTLDRTGVIATARICRDTAQRDRQLAEEGKQGAWRP